MPQPPDGLEENGMLKPPSGHEQPGVKAEGLTTPPQPPPVRILTMDEADLLRAKRAFAGIDETYQMRQIHYALDSQALAMAEYIIKAFPSGKERSQALGNLHQVVLWCMASLEIQEAMKIEANNKRTDA